jgi:hypothetical protein
MASSKQSDVSILTYASSGNLYEAEYIARTQPKQIDIEDSVSLSIHVLLALLFLQFERTALILACRAGHADVCRMLVEYKCNINKKDKV